MSVAIYVQQLKLYVPLLVLSIKKAPPPADSDQ